MSEQSKLKINTVYNWLIFTHEYLENISNQLPIVIIIFQDFATSISLWRHSKSLRWRHVAEECGSVPVPACPRVQDETNQFPFDFPDKTKAPALDCSKPRHRDLPALPTSCLSPPSSMHPASMPRTPRPFPFQGIFSRIHVNNSPRGSS